MLRGSASRPVRRVWSSVRAASPAQPALTRCISTVASAGGKSTVLVYLSKKKRGQGELRTHKGSERGNTQKLEEEPLMSAEDIKAKAEPKEAKKANPK